MTAFLSGLAAWLHVISAIIFIGHYMLLALVYLPALTKNGVDAQTGAALSNISKASRSWLYASIVVFAVTGSYMTLVDPSYKGLGNFSSTWALLMLIKHVLIVGMIAAGFWYNGILHAGPVLGSGSTKALETFKRFVYGMAAAGVVILLLTAWAGEA